MTNASYQVQVGTMASDAALVELWASQPVTAKEEPASERTGEGDVTVTNHSIVQAKGSEAAQWKKIARRSSVEPASGSEVPPAAE
jgi:hypothetical protein